MAINDDDQLYAAIEGLRDFKTDTALIELKRAEHGYPHDGDESICAFANTHGGTVVFGVDERGFRSVPGMDVKAIQARCAQGARELIEPPVAADIQLLHFEGNPVVVANIPEMPTREKPCYIKKWGMRSGSFVRTGDGDHKMSPYEIDRFIENETFGAHNDAILVDGATMDDLRPELVDAWIRRVRDTSYGRVARLDDEAILANARIVGRDGESILRPTIAGLLALGDHPQRFFPRLNVVFSCYETSMKGDANARLRFVDTANIDGPIPEMVTAALQAVSKNIRHGAIVESALRGDVPDYPLVAVREAVANALIHRDYSREAWAMPVAVDLYPDRLEITNPGGLYGTLTVEDLGKPGATASRNGFLVRILEDVVYEDAAGSSGHVVENRGSGFPTIEGELAKALMAPPAVSSDLRAFHITLLHRRMTSQEGEDYAKANVLQAIQTFFLEHESASTSEVAKAAGLSTKTVRGYINSLLASGFLEGIGSKYSPQRRYRVRAEE